MADLKVKRVAETGLSTTFDFPEFSLLARKSDTTILSGIVSNVFVYP